jgi:16S rRNA (guanine(966)-N(2))-methyltransferase RsmD
MRVISGTKKGLKLSSVKFAGIRPTTDRTKEVIFNTIRSSITGSIVLDVFAGTGSLGIEALSQGARKAFFIENNKHALRSLKINIEKTGFYDRVEILSLSADRALKRLAELALKFDIIFADPPYGKNLATMTLASIAQNHLLQKDGWFVIEHSIRESLLNSINSLNLKSVKRQGDTAVSFYQYV